MKVNFAKFALSLPIAIVGAYFVVQGDNVVSCNLRNTVTSGPHLLETEIRPGQSRYSLSNGATGTFCLVDQTQVDSFKALRSYSTLFAEWSRIGWEPCRKYIKGRVVIATYLHPSKNKEYILTEKFPSSVLPKWKPESSANRQCGHLETDQLWCGLTDDGEQHCSAGPRQH